jgi:hypothetical protein
MEQFFRNIWSDEKHSESILRTAGFVPSELPDIFAVLRAKGGFCDCESLYNASESNRLKAQYRCEPSKGREPRTSHANVLRRTRDSLQVP